MNLRDELRKYNIWTCPDYLHEAWQILFTSYSPPNRREILDQAQQDLQEEERHRPQKLFNENRPHMDERAKLKFNWSNK